MRLQGKLQLLRFAQHPLFQQADQYRAQVGAAQGFAGRQIYRVPRQGGGRHHGHHVGVAACAGQ